MARTAVITISGSAGSLNLSQAISKTDNQLIEIDTTIADGVTNGQFNIAFGEDELESVYLVSDQNITIYVNDAGTGSPTETLSLTANVPLYWYVGAYHTCPFGTDVTGNFFITNSSGATATLQGFVLHDATP